MTEAAPIEWKCGECGAWVDGGWAHHSHIHQTESTVSAMIAARKRGDIDALSSSESTVTKYWRTFKEETRPKNGC